MENVVEKFLRYVKIDTQSEVNSESFPSTAKQLDLLNMLKDELIEMGATEVEIDQYGYVMATIPATTTKDVPVVGFLAHVDTSPDFSGKDVKPQMVDYVEGDIVLNEELGIVMKESDFPEMKDYRGKKLITTDGTTLLGADDKAGVAEIMTAAQYLINNPQIEHGKIRIGFTPDEEVGRGVDFFDVEKFGAQYAYTFDGSHLGQLEYENFNAAGAAITINGRSVHPGYSKNKMINAINIAHELHSMIPPVMRPEHREKREGFYHLNSICGDVSEAKLNYMIRNHSNEEFAKQKQFIQDCVDFLNKKHNGIIDIVIKDQYYNMVEVVSQRMEVVEVARRAMETLNIEPQIIAIRGGTDGARLSFRNLPCPNIFAGGVNYHGKFEFVAIDTMNKAVDTVVEISKEWCNE